MNGQSIFWITFLASTLIIYFFLSRRTISKLMAQLISFQLAGQKIYDEHKILKEQFRQLAAINQMLRENSKSFTNKVPKK